MCAIGAELSHCCSTHKAALAAADVHVICRQDGIKGLAAPAPETLSSRLISPKNLRTQKGVEENPLGSPRIFSSSKLRKFQFSNGRPPKLTGRENHSTGRENHSISQGFQGVAGKRSLLMNGRLPSGNVSLQLHLELSCYSRGKVAG